MLCCPRSTSEYRSLTSSQLSRRLRFAQQILCVAFVLYVTSCAVMTVSNWIRSGADDNDGEGQHCTLETCFNYRKCPIRRPLKVFLETQSIPDDASFLEVHLAKLHTQPEVTHEPAEACVQISFGPPATASGQVAEEVANHEDRPNRLFVRSCQQSICGSTMKSRPERWVQVAALDFPEGAFRPGFDILIPPLIEWRELAPPNDREQKTTLLYVIDHIIDVDRTSLVSVVTGQFKASSEDIFIDVCSRSMDSLFCRPTRYDRMSKAKFGLVLSLVGASTDADLNYILVDLIRHGTIPVIIGDVHLPFETLLAWESAAIRLPAGRLHELQAVLSTYGPADIQRLRSQGSELFQRYMSSPSRVIRSVISSLRNSLKMPTT